MTTVYRIRDWINHFEVWQSKRIVGPLSWVGVPTKHDGKSFRRIIRLPNGPALFGCWCLIVQIAAKCPCRGVLADSDGPLSAEDIEDKTGCPASLLSEAIEVLCSDRIAWLEIVDLSEVNLTPVEINLQAVDDDLGGDRGLLSTRPNRTVQNRTNTGAGLGAGNLMNSKNGTTGHIHLYALDKIRPAHLCDDSVLEALRDALANQAPDFFKSTDSCLLAILAAAERAIEVGKKPVALFVSLVRERQWGILSEAQHARAAQRLKVYRSAQAQKSKSQ